MDNITLIVKGMSCEGCVSSVTRALKAAPGVLTVHVMLSSGEARVAYDGKLTEPAKLKAVIEDAGYDTV